MNTEVWSWIGMAHHYCINNPLVTSLMFLGLVGSAIGFYFFVDINLKIKKVNEQKNQVWAAKNTFIWFTLVFAFCGLSKLIDTLCLFIGIYWLSALCHCVVAVTMVFAYRVYKNQFELFTADVITPEDVIDAENAKVEFYRDQLMKKAKFSMSKMDPEKRQELINIIKQEVI